MIRRQTAPPPALSVDKVSHGDIKYEQVHTGVCDLLVCGATGVGYFRDVSRWNGDIGRHVQTARHLQAVDEVRK